MNGINMVEWDPAADAHLPGPVHFDAHTVVNGKALAKEVLQVAITSPSIGCDYVSMSLRVFQQLATSRPHRRIE